MTPSILAAEGNGINRYIVGCKFNRMSTADLQAFGINRYIVGCKCIYL